MKPNDGLPPSPSLRNTAWPSSATTRTASGPPPATEVRSAPAARMNGLPVTPIATISSSASAASIASFSASSERGPKVFGLVWSSPLSRVIRPSTPAPGSSTLRRWALGHALGVGGDLLGAGEESSMVGHAAAPFQFGFSQITVPPMPMPMHMVVRP